MGGREAQKVYLYDTDGKYLRSFVSCSEFARTFQFAENLFSRDFEVYEFEDGRIAATYKIGREGIKRWRLYKNSEYIKEYKGRKIAETVYIKNGTLRELQLINFDEEVIASFKNEYFAKKLLGIESSSSVNLKYYNEQGLKFRYAQ